MAAQSIKIGVLGLGTVGSGTVEVLKDHATQIIENAGKPIEVKKILVRDKNKKRDTNLDSTFLENKLVESADEILLDDEIEIVVELIGGEEPAKQYMEKALRNGKHVVTANKEVIAEHGKALFNLAKKHGRLLLYEASVAGGIPVIRPLLTSLAGNQVTEINGILNGTTNYMLTEMENNEYPFDDILQKAQELGYAESDPSDDVDGYDAVRKLAIMTSIVTGGQVRPGEIYTEGIRNITLHDIQWLSRAGYRIKLLAYAKMAGDEVESRVCPTFISSEHPLYSIMDVYNSVLIKGNPVGHVTMTGEGAGKGATSSSVVADIIEAARFETGQYFNPGWMKEKDFALRLVEDMHSWYYLRIFVSEESGEKGEAVMKQLKSRLNQMGIGVLESEMFEKPGNAKRDELYLITERATEKDMHSIINTLNAQSGIEVTNWMRGELSV